ncbi:very short patch repair endonuclease [Rhizobium sp. NFR12]|uniref:very short patch repair endonuclease n=1 Tax=Rhizobium sp. NFR12 TaxID=1566261 RepID=UPI0008A7EE13|nr:very short patch repair endonuclease [Rhizobium sp. NFR12]SEH27864.1 T/G mismatch-specific endonuclease [Rhizobium sp. NFR12]
MDRITPERRSANMARIKGKNTKPEMVVRRLVHALGYRYRLHRRDLPGKPDLVFESRKAVIFVHGCFWHQHGDPQCRNAVLPKSRTEFWEAKLRRNVERDVTNIAELEELGYRVEVIWECEIKDLPMITQKITHFLGQPKRSEQLATSV